MPGDEPAVPAQHRGRLHDEKHPAETVAIEDLGENGKDRAVGAVEGRARNLPLRHQLLVLPREVGYGVIPRAKNGPALAGYGAVTMSKALAATMTTLPGQLRQGHRLVALDIQ